MNTQRRNVPPELVAAGLLDNKRCLDHVQSCTFEFMDADVNPEITVDDIRNDYYQAARVIEKLLTEVQRLRRKRSNQRKAFIGLQQAYTELLRVSKEREQRLRIAALGGGVFGGEARPS